MLQSFGKDTIYLKSEDWHHVRFSDERNGFGQQGALRIIRKAW